MPSAQNETKAREENEKRSDWFGGHRRIAFVCECANPECTESLSLDREAYAMNRADPIRFGVAPGHVDYGIERVLERHEHHWIVEKIGAGKWVARREDDPPP